MPVSAGIACFPMMDSSLSGCKHCGSLLSVIQELIARLGSTQDELSTERELNEQLKCLNKYLMDEATGPGTAISKNSNVSRPAGDVLVESGSDCLDEAIVVSDIDTPPSPTNGCLNCELVSRGCKENEVTALDLIKSSPTAFDEHSKPSLQPCSIAFLRGRALTLYRSAISDGVINKPSSYGLVTRRTVLLTGLPPDLSLHTILSQVRSGQVVSASISDTLALTGSMTARIVFLDEHSAKQYAQQAQNPAEHTPLAAMETVRIAVRHQGAFTYPIDQFVAEAILIRSATRILRLSRLPVQATEPELLRDVLCVPGTKQHGIIHVESMQRSMAGWMTSAQSAVADTDSRQNSVVVHFDSIINALRTYERITVRLCRHYLLRGCAVEFAADPCGGGGDAVGSSGINDDAGRDFEDGRDGNDKGVATPADSGISGLEDGEVGEEWLIEL